MGELSLGFGKEEKFSRWNKCTSSEGVSKYKGLEVWTKGVKCGHGFRHCR